MCTEIRSGFDYLCYLGYDIVRGDATVAISDDSYWKSAD